MNENCVSEHNEPVSLELNTSNVKSKCQDCLSMCVLRG